jgi:hypothetical protein
MASWSYGRKGKGKGKYQSQPWEAKGRGKPYGKGNKQEEWSEQWAGEPAEERTQKTTRIPGNYQFVKASLRTAADVDGSCMAGYSKKSGVKLADRAFVSKDNLRECLTVDNSHLVRRPGVGLSECAGSLRAGAAVLDAWADEPSTLGFEALREVLQTRAVQDALRVLDTSDKLPRSVENVRAAFDVVADAFRKNKKLMDTLGKVAIATSRVYVMAMHGLQFGTLVGKPKLWAEQIPEDISDSKVFKKWRASPGNEELMASSMTTLLVEKITNDDKWNKDGNAASSVFGEWGTARSGSEDSASSRKSKDRKNKKRQRSPSASSSSSASDSKKKRKEKIKKSKKATKSKKKKSRSAERSSSNSLSGDSAEARRKKRGSGSGASGGPGGSAAAAGMQGSAATASSAARADSAARARAPPAGASADSAADAEAPAHAGTTAAGADDVENLTAGPIVPQEDSPAENTE